MTHCQLSRLCNAKLEDDSCFKVTSQHLPGGLNKIMKNLSQNSQSPGQDLKLGPPKYEGV